MLGRTLVLGLLPITLAVNAPRGAPAWQKSARPADATVSALWQQPHDLAARNLFHGPWSLSHAPDADAVYTYVRPKTGGTNPGMVVRDPLGREWHVKQPPRTDQGTEGPVEVLGPPVRGDLGLHTDHVGNGSASFMALPEIR